MNGKSVFLSPVLNPFQCDGPRVVDMSSIRSLKVTTLAENLVQAGGLGQWGLSFLLELEDDGGRDRKVVFDTSANREAFLHNVRLLKVDLGDVDCVVISHGHGDHTAATVEVVKATGGVKVYGHPHTFLHRFYEDREGRRRPGGPPEGEGLAEIEAAGGEAVLSADPVEVVPGLWTTGQVERVTPFERISPPTGVGGRRIIVVDGEELDDQILDDQSLWTEVDGVGPWVITGCAHAGPVNTLLQARRLGGFEGIRGLVGGTHLVGRSEEYLVQTITELKRFGLGLISPCHCTGFKATARLWQAFPKEFVLNFCLRVIEAGKMPRDRIV
jgi:7,8-dihydropterin-6-yl-methyl-4-(beta-D-ribofuranosyl)aminobenzene 5'-phosphate synthase